MRAPKPVMWVGGAAALALAGWGALTVLGMGRQDAEPYRTVAVDRGTVARTVSATGTLQPVTTVDIGSTISGPILSVEADFNDRVREGQVLARIDPQTFRARVEQLTAGLAQAQAELDFARLDWERFSKLGEAGYASPQQLSQKRTALDRAEASVRLSTAQLQSAQVDLDRTIIRSPVNGVVVDRRIEPGQTVAASFQAPSLFLIAEDLSQLEALIYVDEADIGEVREGQSVRFNVDAFPGQDFSGTVSQIRQQGVNTQGVVVYRVLVLAENRGGRLLPGMTANAEVLIREEDEALRIPNAALRFRPNDPALLAQAEPGGEDAGRGRRQVAAAGGGGPGGGPGGGGPGGGGPGGGARQLTEALDLSPEQSTQVQQAFQAAFQNASGDRPGPDATPEQRRAFFRKVQESAMRQVEAILTPEQKTRFAQIRQAMAEGGQTRAATLWVLRDGKPQPVRVRLGLADDAYTQIAGGELQPGDEVIIGGGPKGEDEGASRSPMGGGGPGPRIRGV